MNITTVDKKNLKVKLELDGQVSKDNLIKYFLCRSFLRKGVSLGYVGRNQNLKDLKGRSLHGFKVHVPQTN